MTVSTRYIFASDKDSRCQTPCTLRMQIANTESSTPVETPQITINPVTRFSSSVSASTLGVDETPGFGWLVVFLVISILYCRGLE